MTEKITWHVESRKVAELKPHPENPRIFTEKGMRDLKRSFLFLVFKPFQDVSDDIDRPTVPKALVSLRVRYALRPIIR